MIATAVDFAVDVSEQSTTALFTSAVSRGTSSCSIIKHFIRPMVMVENSSAQSGPMGTWGKNPM